MVREDHLFSVVASLAVCFRLSSRESIVCADVAAVLTTSYHTTCLERTGITNGISNMPFCPIRKKISRQLIHLYGRL